LGRQVTSAYRNFVVQYTYIGGAATLAEGYLAAGGWYWDDSWARDMHTLDGHEISIDDWMEEALPTMALMYLVAILEDYLLQALETLYACDPSKLPIDRDRTVRFDDILAARSRDELIEVMIAQEVRGVRRSLPQMIEQFRRFDIPLQQKGLELPRLVEMKATRNLWTHKGGRVDSEYLRDTEEYWRMAREEPPQEGSRRQIEPFYVLDESVLALYLVNTIEGHIVDHWPSVCTVEIPATYSGAGPGEKPPYWPPEPMDPSEEVLF
jgi:hypothetical protein